MTRREPGESRRPQIAAAALKIIAAQGVARLTTAAIAHEVGMTEGAIFRHFDSKEQIVLAAIDRIEELFEEGAPGEEGPALERLRRFFEHRLRVVHDNGGIPRLVFSEELGFAAGEASSTRVQAIRKRAGATIRRFLEQARRDGEVAKDLDVDAAVLVVQGAMMSLVFNKLPRAMTVRVWNTVERLLRSQR